MMMNKEEGGEGEEEEKEKEEEERLTCILGSAVGQALHTLSIKYGG